MGARMSERKKKGAGLSSYSFADCCAYTGITGLAPELSGFYEAFCQKDAAETCFIRIPFVDEVLERYQIEGGLKQRVWEAVREIEEDEILLGFTRFLTADMCGARHRCDLDDYHAMVPEKAMKNQDLYSMLLLMACIEPSMERLRNLAVPRELYESIPYIPLKEQMRRYRETGEGWVHDFPWDMNFYTCSIFRFDRFYFIPYRLEDDIAVFSSQEQNRTVAFFKEEVKLRRDGQRDGVNGIFDEGAFSSQFREQGRTICGTPINPCGIVEDTLVSLEAGEWVQVLGKGDILLGTHIPGGEGYTPERLKTSMGLAKDFFDAYFPEMPIRGFGSESWLYDPHIRLLLGEKSNICRMQDQMYIYPVLSGDGQMWGELYGNGDKPPVELKTTLQKRVWEYVQEGGRMTPASMFLLYGDMGRIGVEVYSDAPARERTVKRLLEHPE